MPGKHTDKQKRQAEHVKESEQKSGKSAVERRALSHMQYHTSGNLEKWLNCQQAVGREEG